MNNWLIILFNILILLTWIYLLYQVYTTDPIIQSQWSGSEPSWGEQYKNLILSVKITAFINGIIVLLTILATFYKVISPSPVITGGKRR